MRPKKHETRRSGDLFRARLDQIINLKHELDAIDWDWIDGEIAPLYSEKGRPGIETRFAVGDTQLPTVADELFGVGVAPRHHRRALSDTNIGLPQPHPVLLGDTVEPIDRRVQQLGVGREGDVLGLHRGVHRNPHQVPGPQRAADVRHPQALGQKQLQLVAEALPPVAQVRALVWELVLEELFPGEVLEIRIVDPALAHAFIGQSVYVFEQQQPDRKARLDPRAGPSRYRAVRSLRRSSPSRSHLRAVPARA